MHNCIFYVFLGMFSCKQKASFRVLSCFNETLSMHTWLFLFVFSMVGLLSTAGFGLTNDPFRGLLGFFSGSPTISSISFDVLETTHRT